MIIKKFFLNVSSVSALFAGIIFGFIAERFLESINQNYILIILFVLIIIIIISIRFLGKAEPNVSIKAIQTEADKEMYSKKGLIVFLSPFICFKEGVRFTEKELDNYMKAGDYRSLFLGELNNTNFGPPIKAFETHFNTIDHLWIITTKMKEGTKGSSNHLKPFIKYLRENYKTEREIRFHFTSDKYTILFDDISQVCNGVVNLIKKIYKDAKTEYDLDAEDIIVDVTSGTVPMTVGAVLASLAKDQDIEVIGSQYHPVSGRPKGPNSAYPLIISYDPLINNVNFLNK